MLFAEALGEEQFKERVKIYATDLDEEALAPARAGSYSTSNGTSRRATCFTST
jgi:two-component system CheB/CheR fusion protein